MRRARFAFVVALLMTKMASARETDQVTAEVLFQEARELLAEGRLDEACPKFMESERLDPATATLLAVATCHERQGQLATAWAEFMEAAGRAQREGRKDREKLARARTRVLAERLSTLTLAVSPELARIEGLRIVRDGVEVGPTVHNRALPIDGGVHEVVLAAPGYVSQTLSVTLAREQDQKTLTLPILEREPEPALLLPSAGITEAPAITDDAPSALTGTQFTGAVLGAAGIGAVIVGGGFLVGALVKKDQSDAHCDARNICSPRGLALRSDAVDRGNVATALGVGGALVGAAGLALYWLGGSNTGRGTERGDGGMSVSLHGAADGFGASCEVGF